MIQNNRENIRTAVDNKTFCPWIFLKNYVPMVIPFAVILIYFLYLFYYARLHSIYVPVHHIDGAFQTASGLFRLKNFEFAGRDFFPYLGIMPVYLLYPLFWARGCNLAATVFSGFFVCRLCMTFSISVIHYFISSRKSFLGSFSISCFCSTLLTFLDLPFISNQFFLPVTSLRIIRQTAPYFCLFLLYLLLKNGSSFRKFIGAAVITGFFILWSNDYAYMTLAFSGSLITFMIFNHHKSSRWKYFLVYAFVTLFSATVFLAIFTAGGFFSLLYYNFHDVAQDQWWCFGSGSFRCFSVKTFFQMFLLEKHHLILPVMAMILIIADIWRNRELSKVFLLFLGVILFFGGLVASFGGYLSAYFFYFYFYGFCTISFYVITFFQDLYFKYIQDNPAFIHPAWFYIPVLVVVFLDFVGVKKSAKRELLSAQNSSAYYYNAKLGGFITTNWKPYFEFLDRNRNCRIQEEYWGLGSAYLSRNSDWKVDSVIHAFGDNREDCRNKIRNKDFIITSSNFYDIFILWNIIQNYWFFEYVFHNFEFKFAAGGKLFVWERKKHEDSFKDADVMFSDKDNTFSFSAPGWYEVELEYDFVPQFRSLMIVQTPLIESSFPLQINPHKRKIKFPVSVYSANQKRKVSSILNPAQFKIKQISAKRFPDNIPDFYFYFSDIHWNYGYHRYTGGFFVRATEENKMKYVRENSILLPDHSIRKIKAVNQYLHYWNVFTDGPAFFFQNVRPHELKVKAAPSSSERSSSPVNERKDNR